MMSTNDQKIPHRIERTRNRHSRAVLDGDTVVIRLARNLSTTEERQHIESLLRRMTKYWLNESKRTAIDPFRKLFEGASVTTVTTDAGRSYVFSLVPGKRTKAKRTPDGFVVQVDARTRRATLHRFLWRLLCAAELPHLDEDVRTLNARTLDARIREVRLTYMTSQWGSCSPRGDIKIGAALLFVPKELRDYVIIHELAHRYHPNHGRRFWNTVETACPDHKELRKKLRNYRMCRP